MARVFSGIQPTGDLHLGNYLGAVRRWAAEQHEHDAIHCVVDLHALTIPRDPAELRAKTNEVTLLLVAAGLDPQAMILFAQSHVPEHTELAWVMECTASHGELSRMVQFKEKSKQAAHVSAGLFTYPALQAADVLLYDTEEVPVGDDQRQHIELARDLAERFNGRYGPTFVVPKHTIPPVGARIMDLQEPTKKMSKSLDSPQGTILVLDDPKAIERKIKRAVTDSDGEVRYDITEKPGLANLLSILAAVTDEQPEAVAEKYTQYGPLKADAAAAVVEALRPLQERYAELAADPGAADAILRTGAEKARAIATPKMAQVRDAVGLTSRH
ncbi:MAG: tryptophan--tRNA ligase [Actinomycetota bacterium]|nr:tryptophan--tRNA ligase [Acidimicrobiia bacterium]MDQ3293998.1 tryptophan--tRNA ligase [Actinomycetota bacterium]